MNNLDGQWTISRNEEAFNEYEYFDTKQAAIDFGKEHFADDNDPPFAFYVGQIESIPMRCNCLADQVIELISEDHADNDGDFGQDYLDNVNTDHVKELDEIIEKAISEWATKHDYHPKHFIVHSIECIEVTE